jgi:LysM repeat protein
VGWKAIQEANPGVDPAKLKPGVTVLKIPEPKPKPAATDATAAPPADGPRIYTVQSGDNLTIIARKFGTTAKAIRSLNGLKTDRIKVGDKLKIPAKAAAPPAASAAAAASSKL